VKERAYQFRIKDCLYHTRKRESVCSNHKMPKSLALTAMRKPSWFISSSSWRYSNRIHLCWVDLLVNGSRRLVVILIVTAV
jgi:hypothetical protein